MKLTAFLLLSIILTSCTLTKRTGNYNGNDRENEANAIFFLVLRISKDSVQEKSVIELVSKTKTAGKIKNNSQNTIDHENYLTIDVFEDGKHLNKMVMAHPLYKSVEYLDNDSLATKYIELNREEFFLRLQTKENNQGKIRISEKLKNTSPKELITIKL